MPGNISKYATSITGVDISNEDVVTTGFDYEQGVMSIWFRPKNPGITYVTIYVENDYSEKGKTTFRIKTDSYQRPIPSKIEHQYLEEGTSITFYIKNLIENNNDIRTLIKDASSSNTDIAIVNVATNQHMLTIKGLSKGDATITAYVCNMLSELGKNDLIPVEIPVTVTEAVYGEN